MAAGAAISYDSSVLDFSVSPEKDGDMRAGGRRRMASGRGHSRTPSDRSLSSSRTSVKRGNAGPAGRPPRGGVDSPWDDDRRAVRRRVQFPDNPHASVDAAMHALQLQSEADREHMGMLKNAIEGIYFAQR